MGLTCIQTGQADARKLDQVHEKATFDRILIDAPCSGLGVLRSKPDIKYNKEEADIKKIGIHSTRDIRKRSPIIEKGWEINL